MDIKITCRACERTYPLAMALDPESNPGYCPMCGQVLAFQYTPTFVAAAEAVMGAGAEFVRQLTMLGELAGGYAIDVTSVLRPVQEALGTQDARLAEPYRPGWPPPTGDAASGGRR